MATRHTVTQGECLSSIAQRYRFQRWEGIYEHPLNDEFRRRRPDPSLIYPGDVLMIPEKDQKRERCSTGTTHTFQLGLSRTRLRIAVQDQSGKPLSEKKFKLIVGDLSKESTLDNEGLIDEEIPADAREGELTVWLDSEEPSRATTWALKIGYLDPIDEISGVQARLNNLGYPCGRVDGVDGPLTQGGVETFQVASELKVDGVAGPKTQGAFKKAYGC